MITGKKRTRVDTMAIKDVFKSVPIKRKLMTNAATANAMPTA